MSLFIKKHWSKAAKFIGVALFAVLMFVNMQLVTSPNKNGDVDLLGLKLSQVIPSAYAEGGDCNLPCAWDDYREACTVFSGVYCLYECGYPAEIYCHYTG
jgi:hypothetical protein